MHESICTMHLEKSTLYVKGYVQWTELQLGNLKGRIEASKEQTCGLLHKENVLERVVRARAIVRRTPKRTCAYPHLPRQKEQ